MYTILPHKYMTKRIQYRFPRCKSKRIAKKWKKNPKYYKTVPRTDVLIQGTNLYAHPSMVKVLKEQLKNTIRPWDGIVFHNLSKYF